MEILIVGTEYAGEIKKSAFTVMNYLMPDEGVLPMHSAINVGPDGDAAVFFGLSGTGKTTLSADPERSLIGDDEHGWGDDLTFNFEGGCYAKTIRLSPMYEPDIFQTTRRFGTVLENVDLDPRTRALDLDSERITENTRGAYPLEFIGNADETGIAGRPRTVVFLTADAFGVLPPIAELTHEQAAYHFISGYTAKLAGTEIGVKEPKATFSACFGAPFMPRHPGEYAAMLVERLERDDVPVWLVNTGWTGGPVRGRRADEHRPHPGHGPGRPRRRARRRSRRGSIRTSAFEVPISCPDVPAAFLDPRTTWADPDAYDRAAAKLERDVPRELRRVRRRGRRPRSLRRPAARPADPSDGGRAALRRRPESDVGAPCRVGEHDDADDERPEAERQRDGQEDEEQPDEGQARRERHDRFSDARVRRPEPPTRCGGWPRPTTMSGRPSHDDRAPRSSPRRGHRRTSILRLDV